jgi:hypothetical protein
MRVQTKIKAGTTRSSGSGPAQHNQTRRKSKARIRR